jgi:methionyl-tRNA synthetase
MATGKTFQISTAIDYPSGKPHLGHTYEKIVADVIARYHRKKGEKVHFSTGLDCHGSKIEKYAKKAGKTPKEFVDELEPFFLKLCKDYDISYDDFIKTTEKRHKDVVIKMINNLFKKGDIYKGTYNGYYCSDCETYYSKEELNNGCCPIHNKQAEFLEEESYFFRMSKYQTKLTEYIKKNPDFIQPSKKRNEILSRLKEPLHDLSLTREKVNWGIPFPIDKKFVVAIWIDALVNYLSSVDYPNKKYKDFWPALHVIGSDIIWHHAVIWGTWLMALDIKLPKIFVHGFIRSETGEKMSKSLGNVIDPSKLVEIYPADSIRYFLLRNISLGEDGDFSEQALIDRHNNELANKLGNLVSRVAGLIEKNGTEKTENKLIKGLNFKKIDKHMDNFELDKALNEIFAFIDICNEYVQKKKPWETKDRKVLFELKESILEISKLLFPFIPSTSEKITEQFSSKNIKKGEILFNKI